MTVTGLPAFGNSNNGEEYLYSNQAGSTVTTPEGIEIAPKPNFFTSIIATTSADRNSWLTYIMSGGKLSIQIGQFSKGKGVTCTCDHICHIDWATCHTPKAGLRLGIM